MVEVFTTDAGIDADHLVVLVDDRHYAPPDNLAPVVRNDTLARYPHIVPILNQLAPLITTPVITSLNEQADIQGMAPRSLAKGFLRQQRLLP